MSFSQYASEFKAKAINAGYSAENIQKCLVYAEPLFAKKLPVIYNTTNLSALVGYNKTYLKKAALYTEYFYRTFEIKKKATKKKRKIKEPLPSLKEIQLWILENILYQVPVSKFAKAYIKKRNILDNVKYHIEKEKVVSLDIMDFFPSITRESVEKIFLSLGYSSNISNLLSKLCTLDGHLPQGAPTSPYLSNIFMRDFDNQIAEFCTKQQVRFTRYADDMVFSGDFSEGGVIEFVKQKVKSLDLKLNTDKTAIMGRNVPQIVTGVLVNKKTQLPRRERSMLRFEMHFIMKFGLSEHLNRTKNTKSNFLKHIQGKINYALYLNPDDQELKKYIEYLKDLEKE